MNKLSILTLLTMCTSFSVQALTVAEFKARIKLAPDKQVFELGLKGIGECKIHTTYVMGHKTYRVVTPKKSGVKMSGALVVNVSPTMKIAHGLVWDGNMVASLARPSAVFPASVYGAFMLADPQVNAARMLKYVLNDCAITNTHLPPQTVNMSALSAAQVKENFKFYSDSSKQLKCTSNVHQQPIFNPTTCQYEVKPIPLGNGFCRKIYQTAAKAGRASVGATGGPSLPPVELHPLTAQLYAEFQVMSLPIATLAEAESATMKQELSAVMDPSYIMFDPALVSSDASTAEVAAKFVGYYDSISVADLTVDSDLVASYTSVKNKVELASYATQVSATLSAHPALSMAALNTTLDAVYEPIRFIRPLFAIGSASCAMQAVSK